MEEKFYLDDFELSLKEQVNQFKMVPSKKVWHGIYNDLHPGRRWPSVMISLLLIFSVVFVGYINSGTDKTAIPANDQAPVQIKEWTEKSQVAIENGKARANQDKEAAVKDEGLQKSDATTTHEVGPLTASEETKSSADSKVDSNPTTNFNSNRFDQSVLLATVLASDASRNGKGYSSNTNRIFPTSQVPGGYADLAKIFGIGSVTGIENTPEILHNGTDFSLLLPFAAMPVATMLTGKQFTNQISINIPSLSNISAGAEIAGTVANKSGAAVPRKAKKRNQRISWIYYAGPYLSTVSLQGRPLKSTASNSILVTALSQPTKNMRVIRSAALGFEAGLQMNYSIVANLQFTIGAHLSRSGYNIVSNLVHPTLSSLALNDPSTGGIYTRSFVTHYGDGTGMSTVTLHNYSYQTSIPVGLQYMVWANDKLKVNLGASVEPSYVVKADAFVLSSDGKNYVNVPDLLRKWNVSSNFAPFVSFRSHKLNWHIGPNIRYQWLSSYEKNYSVKEHLIDYGIRVGISK